MAFYGGEWTTQLPRWVRRGPGAAQKPRRRRRHRPPPGQQGGSGGGEAAPLLLLAEGAGTLDLNGLEELERDAWEDSDKGEVKGASGGQEEAAGASGRGRPGWASPGDGAPAGGGGGGGGLGLSDIEGSGGRAGAGAGRRRRRRGRSVLSSGTVSLDPSRAGSAAGTPAGSGAPSRRGSTAAAAGGGGGREGRSDGPSPSSSVAGRPGEEGGPDPLSLAAAGVGGRRGRASFPSVYDGLSSGDPSSPGGFGRAVPLRRGSLAGGGGPAPLEGFPGTRNSSSTALSALTDSEASGGENEEGGGQSGRGRVSALSGIFDPAGSQQTQQRDDMTEAQIERENAMANQDEDPRHWAEIFQYHGLQPIIWAEGLLPATEYLVRVRAHSPAGFGDRSKPMMISTAPDVPSVPAPPKLSRSTATTLCVVWGPPKRANGSQVDGYMLQIRRAAEGSTEPGEWKTVQFPPRLKYLCMDFHHLEPLKLYEVRVAAVNRIGQGKWSRTGGPFICDDPCQILSIDSFSMHLSWELMVTDNNDTESECFEVQVRDAKTVSDFKTVSNTISTRDYVVGDLQACCYYQFRVRPRAAGGAWPPWHRGALSRIARTRPAPPRRPDRPRQADYDNSDPQCELREHRIVITWDLPPNNGSQLSRYEVQTKFGEANNWEFGGEGDATKYPRFHTFDNLVNGTECWFRIRFFNEFGWSDWSGSSTLILPPLLLPPENFALETQGASWVRVTWQPPVNAKQFPVELYELQVARVRRREGPGAPPHWRVGLVLRGGEDAPLVGTLGDLAPRTNYTLRLRARSLLGWTPFAEPWLHIQAGNRF